MEQIQQMEALFAGSRAIIHDPIYSKFQKSRFISHRKTLYKLKTSTGPDVPRQEQPNYLDNLKKYKRAHKSIQLVFDTRTPENRSLYRRLLQIENKKQKSQSELMGSTVGQGNWYHRRDEEKRKIQKENQVMREKIQGLRKNRLTVSKLRKQFREHDRLFNHVRKIRD